MQKRGCFAVTGGCIAGCPTSVDPSLRAGSDSFKKGFKKKKKIKPNQNGLIEITNKEFSVRSSKDKN